MPEFDLVRLLKTVFQPKAGERVGIFIDLPQPAEVRDWAFLKQKPSETQRIAYEVFYQGLLGRKAELPFSRVEFFAYEPTGGSNLELPPSVTDAQGKTLPLQEVLGGLDIVLYLTTFSATAPLTALAKQIGFRGATMHGCNQTILRTGLAQDYAQVSAKAERFRQAVTRSQKAVAAFEVAGQSLQLTLELDGQEAQKSHGLCPTPGEVANLPAGEIYWVPTGGQGQFPLKFKDGTLAIVDVKGGRISGGTLIRGKPRTFEEAMALFQSDPATGTIGELGLGTQVLPVAGADIQDEKILGTMHVATGRDDHLGGHIDPSKFKDRRHATHEDILFAPHKTPEVRVAGLWLHKDGQQIHILQDYEPSELVKRVAL